MIKLIYEPSIYAVGRMNVCIATLNQFLQDHEFSDGWMSSSEPGGCAWSFGELLAETAGRLCYLSYNTPRPGGNRAYLNHILEVGHGSILEHAVYSFIFTGVSRSLTHELIRHRAGMGYSELSQRYVDQGDCAFVVPPLLCDEVRAAERFVRGRRNPEGRRAITLASYHVRKLPEDSPERAGMDFLVTCDLAQRAYESLRDRILSRGSDTSTAARKAARGAARAVLPESVETMIYVTGNARAWRNFIEQRASPHADLEIRRLAVKVTEALAAHSPHIFGDYEIKDGAVETRFRKV